jgi:hypothetical protein
VTRRPRQRLDDILEAATIAQTIAARGRPTFDDDLVVRLAADPVVGDLTLTYEAMHLPNDPGQRILVYTAEPATPSAEALRLLASWTATADEGSTKPADRPTG